MLIDHNWSASVNICTPVQGDRVAAARLGRTGAVAAAAPMVLFVAFRSANAMLQHATKYSCRIVVKTVVSSSLPKLLCIQKHNQAYSLLGRAARSVKRSKALDLTPSATEHQLSDQNANKTRRGWPRSLHLCCRLPCKDGLVSISLMSSLVFPLL